MIKISFCLFFVLMAFSSYSQELVGKPIVSFLRDQVCHLETETSDGQVGTCTAVRISSSYVLTAEHCARNIETSSLNSIRLRCGDEALEIAEVYESSQYFNFIDKGTRKNLLSGIDFSLLKLKKPKAFIPKFKLLSHIADYEALLVEGLHCELHGYGQNENGRVDVLNSAALDSKVSYAGAVYSMTLNNLGVLGAFTSSAMLPMKNKQLDWLYSSLRPGDSGGPLFCQGKNKVWFLAGIASTLMTGTCPEQFQNHSTKNFWEKLFGRAKIQCSMNTWGLPTEEGLEKIFGSALAY